VRLVTAILWTVAGDPRSAAGRSRVMSLRKHARRVDRQDLALVPVKCLSFTQLSALPPIVPTGGPCTVAFALCEWSTVTEWRY